MRDISSSLRSAVTRWLGTDLGERTFRRLVGLAYHDRLRNAAFGAVRLAAELFMKAGRRHGTSEAIDRQRELFGVAVLEMVGRIVDGRKVPRELIESAGLLWAKALVEAGPSSARKRFEEESGAEPPWVLVIAPTGACNLTCPGCYSGASAAGLSGRTMPYAELNRLLDEAKELWGIRVAVFTGGEPLLYRSESKDILDVVERHPDLLFLIFTNGTLVDAKVARRFSSLGNPTACVSLEGMRASTDARRGPGAFDGVLRAMDTLRDGGATTGVSMTATRHNCDEVLSDELIDLFFGRMGALYGFIFQYMPEGRDPDPLLMPTPEQRLRLWERSWRLIEERRIPLFDFWNHGALVGGCVAAGRERGYIYVDWDGNVLPCVFVPYSAGNIHEMHARGQTLNDAWSSPLMSSMREWQSRHAATEANRRPGPGLLCACPVRDHYGRFKRIVTSTGAVPLDSTAASCLADAGFERKMEGYGREFKALVNRAFKEERP